ncbi:ROK family protein [Belliella sp. DSM 107340]|uniref:ROK family protein n=1 Tax=Belliella calami TaxID=2923436 RepID=A0ABS9UIE4_9BACT|nr:ROK family protein [Belliella calami]MCH7396377.1 ROK family protein [Belliella calami]
MNLINPRKSLESKEGVVEIKNYINKIKLIKNLYSKGNNTAGEICNEVGISLPTVNSLLTDLIKSGEVIKDGRAQSQGGRKPDLYRLSDDSFYIISVDINKFNVTAAIYGSNNKAVTEPKSLKIKLNNEIVTFERICTFLEDVIRESNLKDEKIIAVGISMPGMIDSIHGINHTYLNFGKLDLVANFEQRLGKKVFLENDARAMTLAEFKFGHNEDYKNVLGIFIGWGIGLGIMIDGKIYQGASGFAGEFSHSPIFDSSDITCTCGKKGCLDSIASGTAIVRKAKEAVLTDMESIMARMAKDSEITPELVVNAALDGDQRAITILSQVGLDLGRGISILIQLLNPKLIILGGIVAEAKHYLTTPIQQALNIYSMAKSRENTEITLYKLGREVGLLGGVAVVNEKIFEDIIQS